MSARRAAPAEPSSPPPTLTVFAASGVLVDRPAARRAVRRLRTLGFDARLDPDALARHQRFAGDDAVRLAALHRVADEAPSVALALRGGYGLTRLLDGIDWRRIARSIERGTRPCQRPPATTGTRIPRPAASGRGRWRTTTSAATRPPAVPTT